MDSLSSHLRVHPKFALLAERYFAAMEARLSPGWHKETGRLLSGPLAPLLPVRADQLTRKDIAQCLSTIPSPSVRNNALAVTRALINWAIDQGELDGPNPMARMRKVKLPSRERVLTEAELRAVWRVVSPMRDYAACIRLLMLTGQRRNEIGGLMWSEINFEARQIELPATRTKNRRPHTVPLTDAALALLPARREGYPHLFGKIRGRGFNGWSKCKLLLDYSAIGEMKPWTVHDLRRSFVTHSAEKGLAPPHIIEAFVNHVSGHKGGVAGVYNRAQYKDQCRELAERWSAELARIVGA